MFPCWQLFLRARGQLVPGLRCLCVSGGGGVRYLEGRGGGKVPLAYHHLPPSDPQRASVIFAPGFFSTMDGAKAVSVEEWCRERGLGFTRFDYSCTGLSRGDMRHLLMTDWRDDVTDIIDRVSPGPQVLVGSSMGAWMVLHAALARPHRVRAVLGICAALDFVQPMYDRLPDDVKRRLHETETIQTEYGEYVITRTFLESAKELTLLSSDDDIDVTCPVRLVHGMLDTDVKYEKSVEIAKRLKSNDVDIILRKNGDHRMSLPHHIHLILTVLGQLVTKVEN